jgi:hypothetical protein
MKFVILLCALVAVAVAKPQFGDLTKGLGDLPKPELPKDLPKPDLPKDLPVDPKKIDDVKKTVDDATKKS